MLTKILDTPLYIVFFKTLHLIVLLGYFKLLLWKGKMIQYILSAWSIWFWKPEVVLIFFMMDLFGVVHRWEKQKGPLSKICHTYPAMMKLEIVIPYLKKIKKWNKNKIKVVLINMTTTLIMSAKLTNLRFLKIRVF